MDLPAMRTSRRGRAEWSTTPPAPGWRAPRGYVISADQKTSVQARPPARTLAPTSTRDVRVEHEYDRAIACMTAWVDGKAADECDDVSSGADRWWLAFDGHRQFADRPALPAQPQAQLAPGGLGADPTVEAGAQHVQLGFAHEALHSQQHPVVEQAGAIDTVRVGDQRVAYLGQVQQPVPGSVVMCEAGDLEGQDDPDLAEARSEWSARSRPVDRSPRQISPSPRRRYVRTDR